MKVTVIEKKALSVEEYFDKIIRYLKDTMNNSRKSGTWKIQLTIVNNFIAFIDNDEGCAMHSKIEIVIKHETNVRFLKKININLLKKI